MDRLKQLWASFKQSSPSIVNPSPPDPSCGTRWSHRGHQSSAISSSVYSTTGNDDDDDDGHDESNVDDTLKRTRPFANKVHTISKR